MQQIQQITTDALQQQTIVLPDGSSFQMTMRFVPNQLGWFLQELDYGTFTLYNVRITVSPNILYQWKNVLPFGIACISSDSREPTLQEDFSSGNCNLFLLSQTEVTEYAEYLSGQIPA